jgi:hypothetical protein
MSVSIVFDTMKANPVIAIGVHKIEANSLTCVAFGLFHYIDKLNKFN